MQDRHMFRAKHIHVLSANSKLNGTWVKGYLCSERYIYLPELESEILVDPATIGQCTGLRDATKWEELTLDEQTEFTHSLDFEHCNNPQEHWKGKLIFEGDILHEESLDFNSAVAYNNFTGGYFAFYSSLHDSEKRYKIIGNTIDNPGLLKNDT